MHNAFFTGRWLHSVCPGENALRNSDGGKIGGVKQNARLLPDKKGTVLRFNCRGWGPESDNPGLNGAGKSFSVFG